MSRISEVLIGSVSPFELMMGKLLAASAYRCCSPPSTSPAVYGVAAYWGMQDAITPTLAAWFLLFLTMAVLLFGSIFIAVGAACSDLKDSQSMMMPVMMLIMFPVFTFAFVMRAPDGNLALASVALPNRHAVPDADANRSSARTAALADPALGRDHGAHHLRGGVGSRTDFPHRDPDAGQVPDRSAK